MFGCGSIFIAKVSLLELSQRTMTQFCAKKLETRVVILRHTFQIEI